MFYLSIIIIFILDRITKFLVLKYLYFSSVRIIGDYVRLSYVENTGVSFGMMKGNNAKFLVANILIAGLIFIFRKKIKAEFIRKSANENPPQSPFDKGGKQGGFTRDKLYDIILGMIIGGAFGNIFDRIYYGFVVDFVDVGINYNLRWPVFNVADSAVFISMVTLILMELMKKKQDTLSAKSSN